MTSLKREISQQTPTSSYVEMWHMAATGCKSLRNLRSLQGPHCFSWPSPSPAQGAPEQMAKKIKKLTSRALLMLASRGDETEPCLNS